MSIPSPEMAVVGLAQRHPDRSTSPVHLGWALDPTITECGIDTFGYEGWAHWTTTPGEALKRITCHRCFATRRYDELAKEKV